MWEPEPGWLAMPGGTGTSTVGVWRAAIGDQPVVIKRLAAPQHGDPADLSDPGHGAYWRREADVLSTGIVMGTPGLRAVSASVEEDADGVTITREWVEDAATSGLFVAHGLGRFAGADLPRPQVPRPRPAAAAARPHRAPRGRLADPGPHHRGRRRRAPVVASGGRSSTSSTRCRRCPSTATPRT